MEGTTRLCVAVELPQHGGLTGALDYLARPDVAPGQLLRVPLGSRTVTGIAWEPTHPSAAGLAAALKPVSEVLASVPPLPPTWRRLVGFAAEYYHRGLGELALSVLPPELRKLDAAKLAVRDQIQSAVADVAGRAGELATGRRPDDAMVNRVVGEVMAR